MTTTVQAAGPEHRDAIVALLAPAFGTTPIAHWLIPPTGLRETCATVHFDTVVTAALHDRRATIDVITDPDTRAVLATAIWYDDRGSHTTTAVSDYFTHLSRLIGADNQGVHARATLLKDRLRQLGVTARHHRLAYLAVDPAHRKQGLAQTLLTHHHQHLDTHGIAAHTIAQSSTDLAVLAFTGYRCSHPTTVADGVLIWPALRHPRPRGAR